MKLDVALGELLAADTMVNVCQFVHFWNRERFTDADRLRVAQVDDDVHAELNDGGAKYQTSPDPKAAHEEFVAVVRSAAAALRTLVAFVELPSFMRD